MGKVTLGRPGIGRASCLFCVHRAEYRYADFARFGTPDRVNCSPHNPWYVSLLMSCQSTHTSEILDVAHNPKLGFHPAVPFNDRKCLGVSDLLLGELSVTRQL